MFYISPIYDGPFRHIEFKAMVEKTSCIFSNNDWNSDERYNGSCVLDSHLFFTGWLLRLRILPRSRSGQAWDTDYALRDAQSKFSAHCIQGEQFLNEFLAGPRNKSGPSRQTWRNAEKSLRNVAYNCLGNFLARCTFSCSFQMLSFLSWRIYLQPKSVDSQIRGNWRWSHGWENSRSREKTSRRQYRFLFPWAKVTIFTVVKNNINSEKLKSGTKLLWSKFTITNGKMPMVKSLQFCHRLTISQMSGLSFIT